MNERFFYVENITRRLSNCLWFWKKGDCGYDCSLDDARVWTMSELENKRIPGNKKYTIWPKEYLDRMAHRHVDFRLIDQEERCLI